MSKLRLVRERRTNNQEYDQDLRGLMPDDLMTGPMVYPVLSCSSDNPRLFSDPKIVGLIQEEFNCRIARDEKNKSLIHIVFHDQSVLAPKLQTLRLFFLGVTLSALCKGSDLSVGLWEARPFAHKLLNATRGESYNQGLNPTAFFVPEFLRKDALFAVQFPVTQYLRQAGIPGFIDHSEGERVLDSRALAASLVAEPVVVPSVRKGKAA
jgi:hypothetical protein